MNYVGGYRFDVEDRISLAENSEHGWAKPLYGAFEAQEFDSVPAWLQIENQGSQGSCQGHSLTTSAELCYWVASGGEVIQLNRQVAYIWSQREDNIDGDRGSTIGGGVKVVKGTGLPREELFPYPRQYISRFPNEDELKEDAKKYTLAKSFACESYDDVYTFLGSGAGGVHIGIMWGNSMEPRNGIVESWSPGSAGGHSINLSFISNRKDSSGKNYVWLVNSWGTKWGNKGCCEVSPKAIEQMLRHKFTVMVGLSDMDTIKPRPFPWRKGIFA